MSMISFDCITHFQNRGLYMAISLLAVRPEAPARSGGIKIKRRWMFIIKGQGGKTQNLSIIFDILFHCSLSSLFLKTNLRPRILCCICICICNCCSCCGVSCCICSNCCRCCCNCCCKSCCCCICCCNCCCCLGRTALPTLVPFCS